MKNKDTKNLPQVIDPDTGEILTPNGNMLSLRALEQQIEMGKNNMRMGAMLIGIALKSIRDDNLFILCGCETMKDYCEKYVGISQRSAERYLQLASSFSEPVLKQLTDEGVPQKKILDLSKNRDLKAAIEAGDIEIDGGQFVYPDGTVEDIDAAVDRIRKEVAREAEKDKEKMRFQVDNMSRQVKGQKDAARLLEDEITRQKEHIEELNAAISKLATRKDIKAEAMALVLHKREAVELIEENTPAILKLIGQIENIPKDLIDAELAGQISFFLSALEAALQRCRDEFEIHMFIPGKKERPLDVVPE